MILAEGIELAKKRKKFSVLVIPDDGSKSFEFQFSYSLLWVMGVVLVFSLYMVFAGFGFFFQARSWEHAAQTRERDNARLRADVARVDELAQLVTHMKAGEQQLRSVLASHISLPPAPYETRSAEVATLLERPSVRRDSHWRPAIWPISPAVGWIMRGFELAEGIVQTRHFGIDIAAVAGTPVRATADGQVKFAGADPALGYLLVIDHGGIYTTRYGNNGVLLVKAGTRVRQGQYIALVGSSERGAPPHLHYEVIESGRARDPRDFLPEE